MIQDKTFDDIYEEFCFYYLDDGSNEEKMRESLINNIKLFVEQNKECEHPYFYVFQSDTECFCSKCGKDLTGNEEN